MHSQSPLQAVPVHSQAPFRQCQHTHRLPSGSASTLTGSLQAVPAHSQAPFRQCQHTHRLPSGSASTLTGSLQAVPAHSQSPLQAVPVHSQAPFRQCQHTHRLPSGSASTLTGSLQAVPAHSQAPFRQCQHTHRLPSGSASTLTGSLQAVPAHSQAPFRQYLWTHSLSHVDGAYLNNVNWNKNSSYHKAKRTVRRASWILVFLVLILPMAVHVMRVSIAACWVRLILSRPITDFMIYICNPAFRIIGHRLYNVYNVFFIVIRIVSIFLRTKFKLFRRITTRYV